MRENVHGSTQFNDERVSFNSRQIGKTSDFSVDRRSAQQLVADAFLKPWSQPESVTQAINQLVDQLERMHSSGVTSSPTRNVQGRLDAIIEIIDSGFEDPSGLQDDADYLFVDPLPQYVPSEWVEAAASFSSNDDPDFVLPWNESDGL